MNNTPDRPAVRRLHDLVAGEARLEAGPLDIEDACRRYAEEGYEVTPRLREFLTDYGELTVTWTWRQREVELTTAVERTLEATHALPRNVRIDAKRIGQSLVLIGTAWDTEDVVLLAENDDIFISGDAGIQRIANGFENAIRAIGTDSWDKTFF
ncbi:MULTISPECIES: SUKH-3 domain-containing protein [unclassified Streptomyces]|uniref:SUKH-3 domain-containing protein n=1 Tax=unclassified Streptomyces TaxID=2593676 RepID=UPI0015E1420D|nr:SUKH-3 domain-containing protein [Streptomyces sp. CB02959]